MKNINPTPVRLKRSQENPILIPTDLPWENMLVFNPGAIVNNGKIYLIYRAMGTSNPVSKLGLATSDDGIHFERQKNPIYYGGKHDTEKLGIEDARIVKIEDTFYIVYTAVSQRKHGQINPKWIEQIDKKPQIALSTTKDFVRYLDYDVIIPGVEGKDASLFPKKTNGEYWLLYRVNSDTTYFANSPRLDYWPETYPVFDKRPGFWDCARAGVGAPPIETEKGWLLFYHGVDQSNVYRIGVMFLDLKDPRKIIYRSKEPVFEPETDYEKLGFTSNAVFTCGAIEKDEKYYIYYGASDQVIGLATIDKNQVMNIF